MPLRIKIRFAVWLKFMTGFSKFWQFWRFLLICFQNSWWFPLPPTTSLFQWRISHWIRKNLASTFFLILDLILVPQIFCHFDWLIEQTRKFRKLSSELWKFLPGKNWTHCDNALNISKKKRMSQPIRRHKVRPFTNYWDWVLIKIQMIDSWKTREKICTWLSPVIR